MAAGVQRPGVTKYAGAPDDEHELVEKVAACALSFERGIGQDFKENSERYYRQYRGFKKFANAWERATPNDKDDLLIDSKKAWGANLHIPLSFRTIETMVPRAIAQRPRMLYLPRRPQDQDNTPSVRVLIDSQQEQIDIELEFQDVMRNGMIYGLGASKSFWRTEYASRRRVEPRALRFNKFRVGDLRKQKTFDDPDFEAIDIFDFMWDPFGSSMRDVQWLVHRTWLSLEQCMHRVEAGAWNTQSAQLLTEDKLRSIGNGQKYDEIWQQRMEASGFASYTHSTRGEQIHEVWEWHDGQRVLTVLDRQVLVQDAENPCCGTMPFQVYRPTKISKQMVGIGEIEPVQHLQRELDTMRSQRRDAATLALCAGYAFDDSAIEEEDLVFGPNAAIRVTNGRPSEALFPLPIKDVPGSSWQEEQVVRGDFDSVTGVNDALAGGDGGQIGTATEAQLVQAALSKRVELKSRRFEVEVVRQAARAFLYLNQRMIVTNRPPIRQPGAAMTLDEAISTGRWEWFDIGPAELQGEFDVIPEGGSMAAENVPQMRQDAAALAGLENNPFVDQKRLLAKRLHLMGIPDPEAWIKQSDPPVPPAVFDALQKMGVNPETIQYAIQVAQASDPQMPGQGPSTGQVDEAMAGDPAQALGVQG